MTNRLIWTYWNSDYALHLRKADQKVGLLSSLKRSGKGKERGTQKGRVLAHYAISSTSVATPCITLAAQIGSKGEGLGPRLATRLGYKLYDSEILDLMAEQSKISRQALDAFDEDSSMGFNFLVSSLLGSPYVVAQDFAKDLARVLHHIGEIGDAVVVGRGSAFAIQGSGVLNVRVIAPFELRLAGLQEDRGYSYTEAEISIAEKDSARAQFVEDYFKRDIEDSEAYDLTINSAFLSSDDLLHLILQAFEAKLANR